jgi:DNA invertase Pin-like site-specific DNA recombinase
MEACGVDLDTTTAMGKLIFQITGAFAEFERSMIRQRIHAGLQRARKAGKVLGRARIDPRSRPQSGDRWKRPRYPGDGAQDGRRP